MTFAAIDSELLGRLFATDAMRSVFSDEAQLSAFLRVEEALARAEAEYGLVPKELANAIAAIKPQQFDIQALGKKTALAGVPTIPFVAELQKLLPESLRGHVHKGATTQDIMDTGLVLKMRDAFSLLEPELVTLVEHLKKLTLRYAETPCVGRTLGQHAAPVTFGFKAAAWLGGVANVASMLPPLKQRALTASLGGPVGTLAALGNKGPQIAEAFARDLDLRAAPHAWHTIRTTIVETGTWMQLLLGALAKMAADVILLSSTDVGEISEPHIPGRGGSSAMPHKRNPVSSIIITAAQIAAKGHVMTLFDAMVAEQERPPGRWQSEWLALPQLFGLVSGALREAVTVAGGLEIHPDRMLQNLERTNGLLFAEAVAARLTERLSRADAQALMEQAAERVRNSANNLRQVLKEPAFAEKLQGVSIEEAFDLKPFIDAAAYWAKTAVQSAANLPAAL